MLIYVTDYTELIESSCAGNSSTEQVPPEEIVVLAPYKYTSSNLGIKDLVEKEGIFTASLKNINDGKVRIGTIQAFKGLEADVVILCGLDGKLPGRSPANLYVGATRARAMLHVIKQKDFVI